MEVEKKTEDSPQNDTAQDEESAVSEAASEDSSKKRKLEDDGDSEEAQNVKKMKVDEEKEEGADGGEESAKKGETTDETEGDKDTKPDEKLSSPAVVEEGDKDGDKDGDKERDSEPAEPSQQQEEAMEVEESTAEKDKEQPEEKEEGEEEEAPSTEKADTSEEGKEEVQESKTETAESNEGPESEKEEKNELVQRRYPMRHRRGEDKGASLSAKANSSASDAKQGSGREDACLENDSARAGSVKSDSGSDKENLNSDAAGDVSNAGTPDVIMLSEEEETEQWKEMKAKKRKQVRRLQAHLRNEEAKLVLLKKLRQSQLTPQVQDHTPVPNSTNSQLAKQATPRQQGGPPPLVRGSQQVRGSNLHLQQQQQQQQNRLSSQGQMRNIQGPPPLVNPRMGSSNTANGHSSQNLRNSTAHLNQHGSSSLRPSQQQPQSTPQHQQAATPPQVDTQTPAQRQAAAKLALRKQLEKTLLQIPPPKPPAPEMNFIPSLACPDFVLLLGLEEVVNHIIDLQLIARGQKSPDEKFICNPFTCVQCNTDYTPVWKREKPGSKNVICEHCVTWNQKRALKQEHTNRLKSAFVKALQQEQEIERMQAQTPSNPSTPTPSGTPPSSASSSGSSQTLAAAAAASNVAAAAAMSMNPASFRHSAEQVRQHHNFLQAQAQLRAGQSLPGLQGFGARSAFPYNLPYVKQADLQRQYLLDLMPRTGGMPWKQ